MKRNMIIFAILMFSFTLIFSHVSFAQQKVDWDMFSKNLVKALKTPNTGLQVSAMQKVITYADKLDISDAALELVRLYRNHKDERVRQLALVTINATNNDWAAGIVKRDYNFEKSAKIKRVMAAIIAANEKKNTL